MNLSVHRVSDKTVWEHDLKQYSEANFLQSWNWGEFERSLGKQIFPLQVLSENTVVGMALVITEHARRGTYLTIAGGPLLLWNTKNTSAIWAALETELRKIGTEVKASFVRLRLQEKASPEITSFLQKRGLKPSPMHLTADLTLQLDLTQPLEKILQNMRKNTRGEVRKAEKLGITVTQSTDPNEIQDFYEQQLAVASRQGFVPFSYDFLSQQFEAFLPDNQVCLFQSWQDKQLLASAFVIFYNGEAVYHYGISTAANVKLPGSYACQWSAIQEAQARGMTRYNFWGVAPLDEPNHRFSGVGLFKRGFGGQEVQYQPAYDLPLSWNYAITRNFELLRKKLRRL